MNEKIITCVMMMGFALFFCGEVFGEQVEISTYYPSPVGKYRNLESTDNTNLATQAGRVGIGPTAPNEKLHVSGGNIIVDSQNAIGWGNRSVQIFGDTTAAATYMRFDTAGAETMRLNNSGNLGIGTAAAAGMRLDVNGNARVSGTVTITGGSPAVGKVLTSDGAGNATWQTPVALYAP